MPKLSNKKGKVIQGLYESGLSISEVATQLNLSFSGVKYYLTKQKVKIRDRSSAGLLKHNKRLKSHTSHLSLEVSNNLRDLYVLGLSLYWGEGAKTGNTIAITNSDPDLIMAFLLFLKKICCIDEKRLRVLVHYHDDQNEEELIHFWSFLTKISKKQFYKSTIHKASTKQSTNRLKFGTISLRYSDTVLHKEILVAVKRLYKSL